MSKLSNVTKAEKQRIAKTILTLKNKDHKISNTKIAKVVGRSRQVVDGIAHEVLKDLRTPLEDSEFESLKAEYKKKIDHIRFQTIIEADTRVQEAIKNGKMDAYRMIGASKTYYDQSYGISDAANVNVAPQINVQVVEGGANYVKPQDPKQ